MQKNLFGADADDDVTDWGEVSMEEKRHALTGSHFKIQDEKIMVRAVSGSKWEIASIGQCAEYATILRDALRAAEKADKRANNCQEHEPEMAPESCEKCFPLADDARLKRWAALGISKPTQ
jgi:predicted Zn-dependent protease